MLYKSDLNNNPNAWNVGKFLDLCTGIWVSFAPKTYLSKCWVGQGNKMGETLPLCTLHTLDLSPNTSQYLLQFNAWMRELSLIWVMSSKSWIIACHWFSFSKRDQRKQRLWLYLAWSDESSSIPLKLARMIRSIGTIILQEKLLEKSQLWLGVWGTSLNRL